MKFTYDSYINLLDKIKDNGYHVIFYDEINNYEKFVILRHDIDCSISKALKMAESENAKGVRSTYFFMLSTNHYNIASKNSLDLIRKVHSYGHRIGLHFDEEKYNKQNVSIHDAVTKELTIMKDITDMNVEYVSMHRPSKQTLNANYNFGNVINTYSSTFFTNIKYLSDSRHRWLEDVELIINNSMNNRIQLLTHPIWYNEKEINIHDSLQSFIKEASADRYRELSDNIRDFHELDLDY